MTISIELMEDNALGARIKVVGVGGSGGNAGGALVGLTGIVDCIEFRNEVLGQRDRLEDRKSGGHHTAPSDSTGSDASVLEDIRDTLKRIEQHMADKG